MKNAFCLALLFYLFVLACQRPATSSDRQLRFGQGGGFTGAVREYVLHENGQLFEFNGLTKESTALKTLPKKKTKSLFAAADEAGVASASFSHPGNLYYFVALGTAEATRVTWGDPNHSAPSAFTQLYAQLQSTIK